MNTVPLGVQVTHDGVAGGVRLLAVLRGMRFLPVPAGDAASEMVRESAVRSVANTSSELASLPAQLLDGGGVCCC